MMLLPLLAAASCLVNVASAFSAIAPTAPAAVSTGILDALRTTPLVRASDSQPIALPSQWRSGTPFGIADEVAVVAFLRHFGLFLCWEHAEQLKSRVLPATASGAGSGKVFFVGVGTSEAAAEFARQLDIDPRLCFGDEGGAAGDALNLKKGVGTMWNPPAVGAMMERNDQESLTALGEAYKNAADNIGIQSLAPREIKDTLRQGGTFVFKGEELLLEHYDDKVGDNASIDDILACISR